MNVMKEHRSKSNLQQLFHIMFCKNIARLAVAREHHRAVTHSYAPQQWLNKRYSYRTYYGKVVANLILNNFSLKKFFKILIFQREYIEMCFYGSQHPSSIKYPLNNLYSKYHPFMFICLLNINSPVFPSLDVIYCTQDKSLRSPKE